MGVLELEAFQLRKNITGGTSKLGSKAAALSKNFIAGPGRLDTLNRQ